MGRALPHRRLHRLLHQHSPRDDRRQAVPPRQPAAAQLQVGADRLPRPGLVDHRQRAIVPAAASARPRRPTPRRRRSGPSRRLDYELELGAFIGRRTTLGEPVSIEDAESHLFGIGLFNDWCARDIQGWEYQPLGPFLSKNFASTLSPWIVTMEALAPFRIAPSSGPRATPQPLPYLDSAANRAPRRDRHRARGLAADRKDARGGRARCAADALELHRCATGRSRSCVAHHTVNGCNLQPGDLLGSGTLSGPERRAGRFAARAEPGRQGAAQARERRDAHLPRRRRHRHPARALRTRGGPPHRFRRMPRHCSCCALDDP